MTMLSIYFSIWEAGTLIFFFLVKGRMRTLSICGKKYSSIPSKRADGEEVSTITGFCSLNESGCPS